jgi:hypothetical protein
MNLKFKELLTEIQFFMAFGFLLIMFSIALGIMLIDLKIQEIFEKFSENEEFL